MNIDERQIDRGRRLNRLLSHPDFEPLLTEWRDRIDLYAHRVERNRRGVTPDSEILCNLDRLQELRDLRRWIDDEIAAGGEEIKKQQLSQQSQKDLQDVKSTDPTDSERQSEA